eukprot:TRINITY_DN10036_c0_g1_i2.p1 TRINITY_DN10036_c0_g1~~TRINITY_DN10036_c0_g1_i2.p1  ORF type:complete len:367 (-),score=58.49 TRINITY_DN10036_c0_g1_i2:23-1123(-)
MCSLASIKARYNQLGKWTLGLILLGLVVFIWVGGSVFIQFIFTNQDFTRPFFLTYYNTCLFSVYLVGFALFPKWRNPTSRKEEETVVLEQEETDKEPELPTATWRETALISAVFCPIWFLANYTFNLSLSLTSVSSNTIISTTSSFFSLVLGALVGIEQLSFVKVLAIGICIGGVSLVSITDNEDQGTQPLMGDGLALASAMAYGVYTVYLRKSTDGKEVSMAMMLGFVGLFNLISLWPFILLLHFTGTEVFDAPSAVTMGYLTANALIGTVLSDLLWCKVVILTSPLVATLGLSLTIPLALLSDLIINHTKFRWEALLGSGLVFIGFVLVNVTTAEKEKKFFLGLWDKFKGRGAHHHQHQEIPEE